MSAFCPRADISFTTGTRSSASRSTGPSRQLASCPSSCPHEIQSASTSHDWDRTGDALNRGRHAARRDQLIPRQHLPCDALAGQHDREGCGSPAAPLTPLCSTGRHGMLLSRDGHWSATTPSAILIWCGIAKKGSGRVVTPFKEKQLTTFVEFEKWLDEKQLLGSTVLYRGHRESKWRLESTLYRSRQELPPEGHPALDVPIDKYSDAAANMQVIVETHTNRVFGKIDKSANPFPIDGEALSFEYGTCQRL